MTRAPRLGWFLPVLVAACASAARSEPARRGVGAIGTGWIGWSHVIATAARSSSAKEDGPADEPITPTGPVGRVIADYGTPLTGNARRYISDLYLTRLSKGATIELRDRKVARDEHEKRIILIRVLASGHRDAGRMGWVTLTDTSFVDDLDPQTETISPDAAASSPR